MAVSEKFKQMGTFYKYYTGEVVAPVPTIFIGGNHEASNFMQELYVIEGMVDYRLRRGSRNTEEEGGRRREEEGWRKRIKEMRGMQSKVDGRGGSRKTEGEGEEDTEETEIMWRTEKEKEKDLPRREEGEEGRMTFLIVAYSTRPFGGWAAPNIYYMGYAGVINFGGVRIAGISGIYKHYNYDKGL
jgi:hypothetical protein